jgi:hypothetical protein
VFGRQILMVNHQGNGVNMGMAVAAESGFGAASAHRAAFFTMWFHGEGGAPIANMAKPPEDNDVWWPASFIFDTLPFLGTNLGDVETTGVVGMAIGYGVAVSELVEPLVRADVLSLRPPDGDSDTTTMLGASAGLRLRFNEWGPWQAELLGGYEKAYGIEPYQIGSGLFVDLGTGFHIVHCRYGIDVGTRLRIGVGDNNSNLATLAFVLGFVKGNTEGAPGRPKKTCADFDKPR